MNPETSVGPVWNKVQGMINGAIILLPNIVLALIVFALFFSLRGGLNCWSSALPAGIGRRGIWGWYLDVCPKEL